MQDVMPETTPKKITKRVIKFCKTLGDVSKPIYLPFTNISEKYLARHCLSNCEAEAHYTGDLIIYGWTIWEERSSKFIEAEFHAVIKRKSSYQDITPRVDGEKKVLFVHDNKRTANRIDNRTWNTWENQKSWNGKIEKTKPKEMRNIHDDKQFQA